MRRHSGVASAQPLARAGHSRLPLPLLPPPVQQTQETRPPESERIRRREARPAEVHDGRVAVPPIAVEVPRRQLARVAARAVPPVHACHLDADLHRRPRGRQVSRSRPRLVGTVAAANHRARGGGRRSSAAAAQEQGKRQLSGGRSSAAATQECGAGRRGGDGQGAFVRAGPPHRPCTVLFC